MREAPQPPTYPRVHQWEASVQPVLCRRGRHWQRVVEHHRLTDVEDGVQHWQKYLGLGCYAYQRGPLHDWHCLDGWLGLWFCSSLFIFSYFREGVWQAIASIDWTTLCFPVWHRTIRTLTVFLCTLLEQFMWDVVNSSSQATYSYLDLFPYDWRSVGSVVVICLLCRMLCGGVLSSAGCCTSRCNIQSIGRQSCCMWDDFCHRWLKFCTDLSWRGSL